MRLWRELRDGATVLVSPIVYFEMRRGLLKRDAQRLMQAFDEMVDRHLWIDVSRGDWESAAVLWARTQSRGRPIEDSDLLIAAQANRRSAIVITDNLRHFRDTADRVEAW